jgi:hypothetical protein
MPLHWLIELLVDVGVSAATDSVVSRISDRQSHLDVEIAALRETVSPYDLRIMLTDVARAGIEEHSFNKAETREFVRTHVRVPLSQMIQRGEVSHGDCVTIDWDEGISLSSLPAEG